MMIKEVAEEVGVHPSTVSRAVSSKYAHTPQGVIELRSFFSESVNGPEGGDMSLQTLKRLVKKMIEEEDTAIRSPTITSPKNSATPAFKSPAAPWPNIAKTCAFPAPISAGSRRRSRTAIVKPAAQRRDGRQLVILTGLSGSGKSTVLKTFEDLGFYCVDNLPVDLIPTFSELHVYGSSEKSSARALLVDAREGDQLEQLAAHLQAVSPRSARDAGFYRSLRGRAAAAVQRDAPAASAGSRPSRCAKACSRERELMAPIRKIADVVIDTIEIQRSRAAPVHHPPLSDPNASGR